MNGRPTVITTDTESRIERHLKNQRGASSVRLLDHSILVLDKEGRSIRRVHEIIYVAAAEMQKRSASLVFPTRRFLAIFTRKADGRRFYAEQSDKKDSLTIPNIERGDYLVASYLEPNLDRGTTDGLFLSQRVYFETSTSPLKSSVLMSSCPPLWNTPLIRATERQLRRSIFARTCAISRSVSLAPSHM